MNFAPIIIPTLCRFQHFKRCVESLSRCKYATETELYIALDYPLKDSHKEGYNQIKAYIPSIKGFKKVITIERDKNYGAKENLYDTIKLVTSKFDQYIISEDDNEFSYTFLEYINQGLEKYKNDPKVYAICGYNYPIDMSLCKDNIYSSHYYSAWGTGLWRSKTINIDRKEALNIVSSPSMILRFLKKQPHLLRFLISMLNKQKIYGDAIKQSWLVKNNAFCIFPKISQVRNWGHDGSGLHGGNTNPELDIYLNQEINKERSFIFDDIKLSEIMESTLKEHFKLSKKGLVITILLILPYLLRIKK